MLTSSRGEAARQIHVGWAASARVDKFGQLGTYNATFIVTDHSVANDVTVVDNRK